MPEDNRWLQKHQQPDKEEGRDVNTEWTQWDTGENYYGGDSNQE